MWKKILGIIILFYLSATLQSSFFAHFNLFGAVLNLVFILFFLLVFFIKSGPHADAGYKIIFLSVIAGIFLDIFSYSYLGQSVIILAIIGFALKKMQSLLKNREDGRPFIYFLPLFIVFFAAYELFSGAFGIKIIFPVVYNSLIASALFYFFKWQKFTK